MNIDMWLVKSQTVSIYINPSTQKTEKKLRRKIKEYNEDRIKYTVKVEATTFRDYTEFWMRTVKYPILKPVSYDRLEQTYNAVCNYIGWIQLGSVSTEDILTTYLSTKLTTY